MTFCNQLLYFFELIVYEDCTDNGIPFISKKIVIRKCSMLTEYNWIDRKKYLQIKYNVDTCTIFTCRIVRKYCQNRDFSKLHAEPKN